MPRTARRHRGPWRRPLLWVAAAAGALLVVGLLDSRIETEVDLSLLYAAAVFGAGWWLGRRYAAIAGVLAGATWIFNEAARRPDADTRFVVWNGLTRLLLFLFVGFAAARFRADRRRLRRSKRVLEEEITRARTDLPTELLNTRGFIETIDREISDAGRRGHTFALTAVDIDGFRHYSEDHDPEAADALAKRIAVILRKAIRASDTPARLSRDEFAVAFWDVERETVEKTLRRVISGVAALAAEDPSARVSASIGVAFYDSPPDDPQEALRQAEKALHLARDSGRGTLFVWEPDAEEPALAPAAAPATES
ncbi:MAG TPA: GGDEF domain-containing protein [Thermoanaerobaculia bacterium]|nr:GGDEF domain-containing protein [Thermoanaerobaculia bacterium]